MSMLANVTMEAQLLFRRVFSATQPRLPHTAGRNG